MPKVAVCMAGCGMLDGTEIHEAVCTLLALNQAGAEPVCCAPDKAQRDVIDHTRQTPVPGESRNALIEAARIARGNIQPLSAVEVRSLDALIFPGGYGAAKNLCTFAADGPNCSVDPAVERLVNDMIELKKPIGAICIAPVLIARILGQKGLAPTLTIGTDRDTAAAIEKMGAKHQRCAVSDIVVDPRYKIVTTPAYMLATGPAEVYAGIRKLVDQVLRMISA